MQTSGHKWRRRQAEKEAKGKHTAAEMEAILSLQKGRCFYCNRKFSEAIKWSKDHILPLSYDGTHFASNLLAACRSCNSRRQEIPFLTYCRLLNLKQYDAMMKHLKRRMDTLVTAKLGHDQLVDLYVAFTLDDPKHHKYLYTLKTEKKEHVAKLLRHPNRKLQKSARVLFSGTKSWIASTVQGAIKEAQLLSELEQHK